MDKGGHGRSTSSIAVGVVTVPPFRHRLRAWFPASGPLLRYGLVGTFNTLLDLTFFTFLSVGLHITPILANVVSTSFVLSVSYVLNRLFVFRSNRPVRSTVVHFVSVTLFTGLIVQSTVIWAVIHLGKLLIPNLSHTVLAPFSKVCAMGAAMVSNYLSYRWIFHRTGLRGHKEEPVPSVR